MASSPSGGGDGSFLFLISALQFLCLSRISSSHNRISQDLAGACGFLGWSFLVVFSATAGVAFLVWRLWLCASAVRSSFARGQTRAVRKVDRMRQSAELLASRLELLSIFFFGAENCYKRCSLDCPIFTTGFCAVGFSGSSSGSTLGNSLRCVSTH